MVMLCSFVTVQLFSSLTSIFAELADKVSVAMRSFNVFVQVFYGIERLLADVTGKATYVHAVAFVAMEHFYVSFKIDFSWFLRLDCFISMWP